MLASSLLTRSAGLTQSSQLTYEHSTRLLLALQPAPHVRFDGYSDNNSLQRDEQRPLDAERPFAHRAGVNALAIERFEGRYMVSGGADGALRMWDLEAAELQESEVQHGSVHKPLATAAKASSHTFGITAVNFYPFDSLAFLSSSYDHTLKLHDSTTLACSASFDLDSNVYSHALSPIAQHLLVACATQHPAVRLVDLRSGAAAHSLAGHGGGAVLSVAWSPREEHVLASGGVDGTVRFWDVRRSAGTLGMLDMEDSLGTTMPGSLRRRMSAKAHAGPVNGITWTGDARFLVTCGHDECVRVWDTMTGANTLSNFGPSIKNKNLSALIPLIVPRALSAVGQEVLFYPNEREILMFETFEGTLLKRLRVPGASCLSQTPSIEQRNALLRNRVTAMAWRVHSIELLSAHADGMIRSWQPRTTLDAMIDDAEREENNGSEVEDDRKRKRQVLEDIQRDLTRRRITYT